MKTFSRAEERFLWGVAGLGFLLPNGLFLYSVFADPGGLREALVNPIALAFMFEAGLLMGLAAWLIARQGGRPGWLGFVLLSLVGSLACSVPAFLALAGRGRQVKPTSRPMP